MIGTKVLLVYFAATGTDVLIFISFSFFFNHKIFFFPINKTLIGNSILM